MKTTYEWAEENGYVKVVRCRECEWWREANGWSDKPSCELTATDCGPEDYCSRGELKYESKAFGDPWVIVEGTPKSGRKSV